MKCTKLVGIALICTLSLCVSKATWAASSIADPLTSANGALFTVSGSDVSHDAGGAHFGTVTAGDGGRSYVRTIDSDYATASFVAGITFTTTSDEQQVFFGLGTGDVALFGTPDWSTLFSSASFWPEINNGKITRFKTANDVNVFADTLVPGIAHGTHRLEMTFDATTQFLQVAIDLNYAGGPFVADTVTSNFPIATANLFAADGWPTEPSRIFFGGDDGAVLRDLNITVVPEPASMVLVASGAMALTAIRRRKR
jgi:hypothetical protein